MMCRVTAPPAAQSAREVASHPPLPRTPPSGLQRRLRILRHRALRWFGAPIAERDRRDVALGPSVWGYGFPAPALAPAPIQRTRSERRLRLAFRA